MTLTKERLIRILIKRMAEIIDIMEIRNLDFGNRWNYENGYFWFSHPTRLNKLLAHYELYKRIVGLPGHIIELGVYKGASLIRLATFRAALENDYSRKIVWFDAFGKFPTESLSLTDDLDFIDRFEEAGGRDLRKLNLKKFLWLRNLRI